MQNRWIPLPGFHCNQKNWKSWTRRVTLVAWFRSRPRKYLPKMSGCFLLPAKGIGHYHGMKFYISGIWRFRAFMEQSKQSLVGTLLATMLQLGALLPLTARHGCYPIMKGWICLKYSKMKSFQPSPPSTSSALKNWRTQWKQNGSVCCIASGAVIGGSTLSAMFPFERAPLWEVATDRYGSCFIVLDDCVQLVRPKTCHR